MKRPVILLAVTLAALLPAGCGGSGSSGSGGTVDVVMWHGYVDVEGDALAAAAKKFNASHPKIHVKLQNYGNADNALQKVLTGIRGGSYPDIAYLYGSWAANIAESPKTVDLKPMIDADSSIDWDDFWPAERRRRTVDDKVIGMPALVDNLALVYNKKLFAGRRRRRADGRLDVGRLPRRREEAHEPGQEAVRLGLRRRRQRGHRVAVRRAALAGGRRHADAGQHAGRVRLRRRRQGR